MKMGIDIGGTLTDFVLYEGSTGEIDTFKLHSTTEKLEQAVLDGLRRVAISGGLWSFTELPGKFSRQLARGDRIRIETPGGGGHGGAE